MNNITKKSISLIIAGGILTSFAGCSSKEVKQIKQNNISVSENVIESYDYEELKDCWVIKYNDARGNKSILFVEILSDLSGNFVYPFKDYSKYLYHSKTNIMEDVVNEYFENCNLGIITSQEKLISYLSSDYGVKPEYSEKEINKSIIRLKEENNNELNEKNYVEATYSSKQKVKK